MDRELVLIVLVLLLAGGGALLAAAAMPRPRSADARASARAVEHRAASRLAFPVLPSLLVLAALIGWASVEPTHAERLPWWTFVAAAPVVVVWTRAIVRAALGARHRAGAVRTAATIGLWRPVVVVATEFSEVLDEQARAATLAHERAHVVHRDPLRLWLGQLATDLQWPIPSAARRFRAWRHALEMARDEEARVHVDGADLAVAILAAARRCVGFCPGATLAPADLDLVTRVLRLLGPVPPLPARGRGRPWFWLPCAGALVISCAVSGVTWGEPIARYLTGH